MESLHLCITAYNQTLAYEKNPTLRTIIVLGIIFLITYALADGIRYGSSWGVAMAIGSMLALYISIRLYRKLSQIKQEEDISE